MGKRTGRIAVLGSLITAAVLCFGSSTAQAAKLVVSSASGDPGAQVTFTVSLTAEGASVAGTQNDITFNANAPVAAKANGKPDCSVNTEIDKAATSFAFRPTNCSASGTCTSIRALVLSTDNVAAIADGSVLYTCKVNIAATATPGANYPLGVTGIILSDPAGNAIAGPTGTDGSVTVKGGGPTVPPTAPPTQPPAACNPPAVQVEKKAAAAGTTVDVNVTLQAGSAQVAGTQNDIGFAGGVSIAAKANGKPDCSVNTEIDKAATSFAFRPTNCSASGTCTSIRALVLSTDNVAAIADKAVLYTCKVAVAATATGTIPLPVTGVILSDPAGNAIAGASGCDGAIVLGPPETPTTPSISPTNTPTPPPPTNTATLAPTAPPTVPPTATKPPATATKPPAATSTPVPATPAEEGGGCQIGTSGNASSAWLLLIPAVGLLAMRRRRR